MRASGLWQLDLPEKKRREQNTENSLGSFRTTFAVESGVLTATQGRKRFLEIVPRS